ncbi:Na(+)/H(+) antiporter subunit C [Leucobacter sp. M11]|uniref:Na(+)/H(+) antiporter subunit C n=1 Tax=Leucobacter sp. M11 TaxID=2993565 RepID=UPI003FA5F964
MPLVLVIAMAVMYACGIYLLLDRSLTRVLLGFLLVGNATNLLIFLMSGPFGESPISREGATAQDMSDPLPQAFILTAIVITFGVSAFFLALIYRSWRLANADTVEDSPQDDEEETAVLLGTEEITDEDVADSSDFDEHDEDAHERDGVARRPEDGSAR